MEHWFDRATKYLANAGVTRRQAIWSTAATVLGVGLPRRSLLAQESPPRPTMGLGTPCSTQQTNGKRAITITAQGSYNNQALILSSTQSSTSGRFPAQTYEVSIELGGKPLYKLTAHVVPGFQRTEVRSTSRSAVPLVRAIADYGTELRGVSHAIVKGANGVAQGFADGRPISSTGQRRAQVIIETPLQRALEDLFSTAKQNATQCSRPRNAAGFAQPPISATRTEFLSSPHYQAATLVESREVAQGSDACEQCHKGCDIQASACGITSVGEAIVDPLSLLGLGGCAYAYWSCGDSCDKEGGPCCAVQCADYCCASGQVCCGVNTLPTCCDSNAVCVYGTGQAGVPYVGCCPGGSDPNPCTYIANYNLDYLAITCRQPGQACCGAYNPCAIGESCVNAEWGVCCPSDQNFCAGACCDGQCITNYPGTSVQVQQCCPRGSVTCTGKDGVISCCSPGSECCGGTCCPAGQCQPGNICCPPGKPICNGTCCANSFCCGGTCCPPFTSSCCGNTCCEDFCVNNICCPKGRHCGSVCCAPGQVCYQGKCVTSCPEGTDASTAPDGSITCCPLYQCNNPNNDNICTEASCPGGVCCGANQVCCPGEYPGSYKCLNPPCPTVIQ